MFLFSCSSQQQEKIKKINELEASVFDSSKLTLNKNIANELVKNYENYVNEYKTDTVCPMYLFKAGELSMSLNDGMKAMMLYKRIEQEYPNYKKVAVSIFLQAFLYENYLNDKESAKRTYSNFISKYPNHELVKDAKASLENIDIPLEDLIKQFEAKASKDSLINQ
ncbi:MAG: hypothetical protein A2046_14715 [Bacteroidetes bacterium GWA2_30_7]|nr:MAG: hypothetical protein A2046_14715 [Bacteroidetes bacterium GWA2_30_7]